MCYNDHVKGNNGVSTLCWSALFMQEATHDLVK